MKFPKDVEIGRYYNVPHVFVLQWYPGINNVWLPINTPLHDDIEYINIKHRHYHIDWRFVPSSIYNKVINPATDYRFSSKAVMEQAFVLMENALDGSRNISGEMKFRRVRAKRAYSSAQFHYDSPMLYNSWPVKLQEGMCGAELRLNKDGQYICPHRGAVVDLKYVDEFGFAVCPAHLLRFDVTTLKAIDKLPKRKTNEQQL